MTDNSSCKSAFVAYVPVLHQGYHLFFENHPEVKALYLVHREDNLDIASLKKDVRCLDIDLLKQSLEAWNRFKNIKILDKKAIEHLQKNTTDSKTKTKLIMPDEDISHFLAEEYFENNEIEFDTTFLRWNKHNVEKQASLIPNKKISQKKFDQLMMNIAIDESQKSSDWWRQVGAVIWVEKAKTSTKNDTIITSHNQHLPSPHQPYFDNDPRNMFHKGKSIEMSSAIHAEADCIAQAAKNGIILENSSMYVTTFPCPICAKLIAKSGIKKLYYAQGYGVLHGQDVLDAYGVELIKVEMEVDQVSKAKQSGHVLNY